MHVKSIMNKTKNRAMHRLKNLPGGYRVPSDATIRSPVSKQRKPQVSSNNPSVNNYIEQTVLRIRVSLM